MGAEWAYKVKKWRRVAVVGRDTSFGWENVGAFSTVFRKLGSKIASFTWVPNSTTDLSPYMSQIPRDVDAVFVEMANVLAVRFIKAYSDFGLQGEVPLLGMPRQLAELLGPAGRGSRGRRRSASTRTRPIATGSRPS